MTGQLVLLLLHYSIDLDYIAPAPKLLVPDTFGAPEGDGLRLLVPDSTGLPPRPGS